MNELERLQNDAKNNVELQKKFEDAKVKAMNENASSDAEVLIQAAKSLGYTITESELEKEFAKEQELSESELNCVNGGVSTTGEDEYGHDYLCMTIWHCNIPFCHGDSIHKGVSCFSNYTCFTVMHHGEGIIE